MSKRMDMVLECQEERVIYQSPKRNMHVVSAFDKVLTRVRCLKHNQRLRFTPILGINPASLDRETQHYCYLVL